MAQTENCLNLPGKLFLIWESMNFVCNEKRVPRDVSFEEVLRCLVHGSGIGEKTSDGGEDTLKVTVEANYEKKGSSYKFGMFEEFG